MKIAFFGTPEFAWNILSWILEYPEVEVALIVSQPDKAIWRKKELQATAVKKIALNAGIEIMQPEKVKKNTDFYEYLKSLDLDFIVVVAYGKIIPTVIFTVSSVISMVLSIIATRPNITSGEFTKEVIIVILEKFHLCFLFLYF